VSRSPQTVSALRSLLSARFPEKARKPCGGVPVSVGPVDDALGGGLPAGRLTELISPAASGGGQTVIARLLAATQAARQRMALVDGSDGFAPGAVPGEMLRHLVWVRCREPGEAFAAADILVRDGNYAVVVVDLRGCAERLLRRTPASTWYRLQRAAEASSVAVLVQTELLLVPAVPWRLILGGPLSLADAEATREDVAGRLSVRAERGAVPVAKEMVG